MAKGEPFLHIGSETYRDDIELPTFSEGFLYERVGKGDARFILGVAEEYEHIIQALGSRAVRCILDVKPRLAQRLGLGGHVSEFLEDAKSDDLYYREERCPEIVLEHDEAHMVWKILHFEYRRLYNPEKSMDRDQLRLYHKLTDELGSWEQGERQKEIDRLPEKLEKQATKLAEREAAKAEAARMEP